jgi:hypothetical protein
MDQADEKQIVGGIEMTRGEVDALIGIINMPGWRLLEKILKNHKAVEADSLLGGKFEVSLQNVGVVQGIYGMAESILMLPVEASNARHSFKQE